MTIASAPTQSQRQTTSAEDHVEIRRRPQIRAERRLSAESRSCGGEKEERWKVFQLSSSGGSSCRRPCCLSYRPRGDRKRTFVFCRGEPHVLHGRGRSSAESRSRLMQSQRCADSTVFRSNLSTPRQPSAADSLEESSGATRGGGHPTACLLGGPPSRLTRGRVGPCGAEERKNSCAALNRGVYEALPSCNPSNCLLRTTTCVGSNYDRAALLK